MQNLLPILSRARLRMYCSQIFPILVPNSRQRTSTMTARRTSSIPRLLVAAAVITFGAYWAGARWGQRQPVKVGAIQRTSGADHSLSTANLAARDAALT